MVLDLTVCKRIQKSIDKVVEIFKDTPDCTIIDFHKGGSRRVLKLTYRVKDKISVSLAGDVIKLGRVPFTVHKGGIRKYPLGNYLYQFLDEDGEVLYVGKTTSLKNRMSKHFCTKTSKGSRNVTTDVTQVLISNPLREVDMNILEPYVIAKLKPSYNIEFSSTEETTIDIPMPDFPTNIYPKIKKEVSTHG